MGLGKTLVAISAILANPSPNPNEGAARQYDEYHYETCATLVVCPSHLVQQWESGNILCYHSFITKVSNGFLAF
jgi:SNF2 family DNA or RNA helicase